MPTALASAAVDASIAGTPAAEHAAIPLSQVRREIFPYLQHDGTPSIEGERVNEREATPVGAIFGSARAARGLREMDIQSQP